MQGSGRYTVGWGLSYAGAKAALVGQPSSTAWVSAEMPHVELFDLGARPGSFAQESEAGFYTWVVREAANRDAAGEFLPAEILDQYGKQRLQGDAM